MCLNEVFLRPTYRDDYARAKVQQTCILCNRAAVDFRNTSLKLEYTVSALCRQCQDRLFHEVAGLPNPRVGGSKECGGSAH
jgi:hypothetical protein